MVKEGEVIYQFDFPDDQKNSKDKQDKSQRR